MKLHQIFEARYYRHDERWFDNAMQVAKRNVDLSYETRGPGEWQDAEAEYWKKYVRWLQQHKKQLQYIWKALKRDRETYIDHVNQHEELRDRLEQNVETWVSTIDPTEYREYIDFVDENNIQGHEEDYLHMAINNMLDILGTVREGVFEAKYAYGDETQWREILEIVNRRPESQLKEFVKDNEKILKQVYNTIRLSFRYFYDMVIDYMDEEPDLYDADDRNPQAIAGSYWNQFPHDMEEEPMWEAVRKRLGGPLFGDVITIFGDYIIDNANRIVNYDDGMAD